MNDRRWAALIASAGCILVLLLFALIPLALGALAITRTARIPFTGPTAPPPAAVPEIQEPRVSPTIPETPAGPESPASPERQVDEDSLNMLYEQVGPGVVSIQAQVVRAGEADLAAGSGFILDEEGHIATNHHVVLGNEQVTVSFFNEIQTTAQVIGRDPDSDLAIIKVEELIPEVHPLPLADSDQVLVGDRVIAIGNPFGLSNTMTYGIVSAVGRVIPSGFTQFNIPQTIQTDAAINPGNSGGPLINTNGEVIGVNAQIRTADGVRASAGVGFAIPSNILNLIAPALIEQGAYQWPWLGVSGVAVDLTVMAANNLQEQRGAYIHTVISGSPADQAGLQGSQTTVDVNGVEVPAGGDVVIAANGQPVRNFDELLNTVVFSRPGDQIVLTILRAGEQLEVPVTLEPRPAGQEVVPSQP